MSSKKLKLAQDLINAKDKMLNLKIRVIKIQGKLLAKMQQELDKDADEVDFARMDELQKKFDEAALADKEIDQSLDKFECLEKLETSIKSIKNKK